MKNVALKYGSTNLFVANVPKVLQFYQIAFGFEQKFYDPDFGFGMLDGGGIEIGIASYEAGERMMPGKFQEPSDDKREGIEIAFYTEEVQSAFDRAVKAGAIPLTEPHKTSWGQTVAYVRSIEGTIIGFCSPIKPESE